MLSLCIQDVLGSNLCLETDYFEVFNGFPQSFSALSVKYFRIGHAHILPYPCHFTFDYYSCHAVIYISLWCLRRSKITVTLLTVIQFMCFYRVCCSFVNLQLAHCARLSHCLWAQWLATQARRNTKKCSISSHLSSLQALYTTVTLKRKIWNQR